MKNSLSGLAAIGLGTAVTIGGTGCGGFSIVLPDIPSQCFQQDVVQTGCYTDEYFIEVCDVDEFGFEYCHDEPVVDVICQDEVVDSYLVCE